jgi:branched-chain amino acid transport system substrate-binding protein
MKSKTLWITIGVLLAVGLGCFLIYQSFERHRRLAAPEIILGSILPLTGDAASYGADAQTAIEIATMQHNARDSATQIKWVFEDDQMAPSKAVSAMNKLLQVNQPLAVLGAFGSSSTLAIAPIAENHGIVLISPTASSPDISNSGQFIFRTWPSDSVEVETMMQSIKTFAPEVRTIAVVAVQNDYGTAVLPFIRAATKSAGLTIVREERFPPGTTDFRVMLENLKTIEPDAIYFVGYYSEIGLALRQARAVGVKSRMLSVAACEDNNLIEVAGDAAEGLVYTRPARSPASHDPQIAKFILEFQAQKNREPSIVARQAYDAARLLMDGIDSGATTSEALRRYLAEVRNFQGAGTQFSFDKNGDAIVPITLATVENGAFVPLKGMQP